MSLNDETALHSNNYRFVFDWSLPYMFVLPGIHIMAHRKTHAAMFSSETLKISKGMSSSHMNTKQVYGIHVFN